MSSQHATLIQRGPWLECRCPTTKKLMFKIHTEHLRVVRKERGRTTHVDLEQILPTPPHYPQESTADIDR